MTTEEKAKAYDEAMERAKEQIKECGDNEGRKKMIQSIFPQLRESEDERIRKWLLECVENLSDGNFVEVSKQDVLFYLEKQKEPTPADGWDYADKRMSHSLYREGFEAGQAVERELSEFEKQKEQKPAWSEEDKRRIDAICELLENTSAIHPNYSHRKLIIWLKSLRPQPHWKPSEEQMEALMLAIEGKCLPTSYMSRRLEDLYDGLASTYRIDAKLD